MHRGRKYVVAGLAAVYVVVGVNALPRHMRDHLIRVHVGGSSAAGLENIHRELRVVFAAGNGHRGTLMASAFAAGSQLWRPFTRAAAALINPSARIKGRCRRNGTDREIFHCAGRLRSVQMPPRGPAFHPSCRARFGIDRPSFNCRLEEICLAGIRIEFNRRLYATPQGKRILAAAMLSFLVACSRPASNESVPALAEEFVYTSLAFSPVTATGQGLHEFKGVHVDMELDDYSRPSIDRQREFYTGFSKRLKAVDTSKLSPEDRADYDILRQQVALALFGLDVERNWARNPTVYVETVGNAIFTPYVLEYAPRPDRLRQIIARLEKVPAFLEPPRRFLFDSPAVWIKVAREENEGNVELIDKTIRADIPADLKAEYDRAAAVALDALSGFDRFLKDDLPKRGRRNADWRIGEDNYRIKFKFALGTDRAPGEVLAAAESDLKSVRARMLELAAPLHRKFYAAHDDHPGADRENRIVSEVLARIADRHSTAASYISDAKTDLDEAREFRTREKPADAALARQSAGDRNAGVSARHLRRGRLQSRAHAGAANWAPSTGSRLFRRTGRRERVESKLREYNFYKLKLLTIHEAMPGHYVQGEFANDVQPKGRRRICGRSSATRPTWKGGHSSPRRPCWTKGSSTTRPNFA